MTVYIVREENQLKIIKVKPELEDDFQTDYAGKILLSGDSIQEALIRFGELPDHVKHPDKYPDPKESSQ